MKDGKVKAAVVGLRFGGEFPGIYRDHPDVYETVICEKDRPLLDAYGDMFGYDERYEDYDELLKSDVDVIHITTGIPNHYELTMKALRAGKHCACTVPMATTLEELEDICRLQKQTGLKYMMMETTVYTFQTLHAKKMMENGEFGKIQYMRGIHFQDMEDWPDYWMGLPPMHYGTHAVAPLLYLSKAKPESVTCCGSGVMRQELVERYGNPFPVETATVRFKGEPFVADITRSLFETAHDYVEGFTILGDKGSIEMNVECEPPRVSRFMDDLEEHLAQQRDPARFGMGARGRWIKTEPAEMDRDNSVLPESIRKYSFEVTVLDADNPHNSIRQGGGHWGSHPYMVHEFLRSVVEDREPEINAAAGAYITAVGVAAHLSAMQQGKPVEIPDFENL